jgi:ergot alkaloid biosynthesis protein
MTQHGTILVTGGTGTTGSRIVSRLADLGHDVVAASRNPDRGGRSGGARAVGFDWHDPATHDKALEDAERVYLIAPVADPDPATVMVPFLERARAAGVRRAVLQSSSAIPGGGPGLGRVHSAVAARFEEWAVLRPSWFMQNFTGDHVHATSIRGDDTVMTATGRGRVGFIDADDIAAVGVAALTGTTAPNTDLVLTGPEALSYDEVASTISRVAGRPIHHRVLTYEQMRDRLATEIPADFAALLAGLDHAISEGAEDRTTDTVEEITGQAPRSFADYAATHTASFTRRVHDGG